jgi:uncharacterized membrane protein
MSVASTMPNGQAKVVTRTVDTVDTWERELRLQMENREHKWEIYRSFIEREPMATIIGALILLALVAALIIGMFTHTAVPSVITNAFLLILGYFFGQHSTQARNLGIKSRHSSRRSKKTGE